MAASRRQGAGRRLIPPASRTPAGYYFAVNPASFNPAEGGQIAMTDAAYFEETGAQSDWHISEVYPIPAWLFEEAEGAFTLGRPRTEWSAEDTVQELRRLGFRESQEFYNLMGVPRTAPVRASVGYPPPSRAATPAPGRPWYERLDDD